MKLYIYKSVADITDRYHSGGGLVIVTDRDPVQVWNSQPNLGLDKWGEGVAPWTDEIPEPDAVYEVGDASECLYIFPDAGCC